MVMRYGHGFVNSRSPVRVRRSAPLIEPAGTNEPKWRNRQTRYVQGVVRVTSWEFKSPLRHRGFPDQRHQPGCGPQRPGLGSGNARTLTTEDRGGQGWSLALR